MLLFASNNADDSRSLSRNIIIVYFDLLIAKMCIQRKNIDYSNLNCYNFVLVVCGKHQLY